MAYSPLETLSSFRLLKIQPDYSENCIACTLHHFDLHSSPKYSALSYRWGDSTRKRRVRVDTYEHHLHENLWSFLHQSWKDKRFGYFWVDGLCINQNNTKERNHQVRLMGEIYHNAEKVIIWLGNDKKGETALRELNESKNYGNEVGKADSASRQSEYRSYGHDLLAYDYWYRIWIIQEIALSRTAYVTCGSASMEIQHFQQTISDVAFNSSSLWMSEGAFGRRMLYYLSQMQRGLKLPLWELLWRFEESLCSDERDRVYGFMGLLSFNNSDHGVSNIEINYEKPTLDVYFDTLFECRTLWCNYNHVLHSLYSNSYTGERKGMSTERRSSIPDALKEYVTRSSTSSRHVACAQSAIGTFEAISLITNAIQSTLKKSYFFDGSSIFSTQLKDRENHTTSHLQDACVIGLILSWCTPSNSKLGERFVWRCCIHQKIQQSVQSEYDKTDQLKRIRFKTVEQCLVTQKLLSLCNFCELQASINAIVSGLALDLLYKDFKADFQIRIYTETDEVGSSLRIDLLSSNWIFSSELFSNLRFSVD
jgi:Heterokaryon incompatibility protein (HET)